MKTLHVHIGTPKTGTSSLQEFCTVNEDVLHGFGYDYPLMPFEFPFVLNRRNGHFLIGSVEAGDREAYAESDARNLVRGLEVVQEAFTTYDDVVLSDESLYTRVVVNDDLTFCEVLTEHARRHGYSLHVIVYLRRPDSFALSLHNQYVKQRSPLVSLQDVLAQTSRFDYFQALERIAAYVGRENITVRIYDRDILEGDGGSIYGDFLSCIGLAMSEAFLIPERDENNSSLPCNVLAIKAIVNELPGCTRTLDKPFHKAATRYAAHYPAEVTRYGLLTAAQRRAFVGQFEESCRKVASVYLHSDEPLFSSAVEGEDEIWHIDNPWMGKDIVEFFRLVKNRQDAGVARARAAGPGEDAGAGDGDAAPHALAEEQVSAFLRYCEALSGLPEGAYERTVYCLGSFFLRRQMRIADGQDVAPIGHVAYLCMAQATLQRCGLATEATELSCTELRHAYDSVYELKDRTRVLEGRSRALEERNRQLEQHVARIERESHPVKRFFKRVGRAIAHPSKIVAYVRRHVGV